MPSMHFYWLVILSTLLATPLYHHHDVSRYMAPFSAAPRPLNTCIAKIGLIDLDDLTKRRHKTHMWNMASLTPSPEERNCRGNQADCLQIFSVSMTNVEVTASVKHR